MIQLKGIEKIYIASDHAGYPLKERIIKDYLIKKKINFSDLGTQSEDSVDYAEFGHAVGNAIKNSIINRGIVICGSGIGISIAANKVKGVRAALCFTKEHAEMSRRHNDSNILALGARMKGGDKILDIVDKWLTTDFEGDRHQRRIEKIEIV